MKYVSFKNSFVIIFLIGILACQSFTESETKIQRELQFSNGTFLITIFRNGKEVEKMGGEKLAAMGEHSKRVALLFRGGDGNMISLWTTTLKSESGSTNGNYKFIEDFKEIRNQQPGQACIVLHLSEDLGGNVSGLNEGSLHLEYQNGKASGNFVASGNIKNDSYEVKGSFENVLLKEK